MIPKIIHLCWLSGDAYPDNIQACIDSWHRVLPDYEIMLWDTKRFDIHSTPWTSEAFALRKYAFAADYIRLYALYNYGGIYLDSDVMVYKSFDDLLHLPYFIGQDFVGAFEPAIIGCEKGTQFIKDVLDAYTDRHFVKADGTLDIHNLPVMFFERLWPKYTFRRIHDKADFIYREGEITLFDHRFFNARNNIMPHRYRKSYCSHLFAASWGGKNQDTLFTKILKSLPMWFANALFGINYHVLRRKQVHHYDPVYRQGRG